MDEEDDGRAARGREPRLLRPLDYFLAVGWVAEDRFGTPVLGKAIVLLRVELLALGVFERGARVEREIEFGVELVVKSLGCPCRSG